MIPHLAALALSCLTATDSPPLAIVDVDVVSMERSTIDAHRTIVIRGDRIVDVGPVADVVVPSDARIVEGRGGCVIPGLIDTHVHTFDRRDLPVFVAHGVTTVRHLNGTGEHLAWRQAIADGSLFGPRFFVSGPHQFGIHDEAEGRALVDADADAGFDFVKVYDDVDAPAYMAMVDEARKRGIRIGGHIPRNLRLDTILAARPDSIEHAEEFLYARFAPELDPAAIPPAVQSIVEAGIAIATTLVTYDAIGRQRADLDAMLDRGENAYVAAWKRRSWGHERNRYRRAFSEADIPELRRRLAYQRHFVRAFHEAGGRVLLGTDAGGPPFVVPGASALDELEQLVRCGMTPVAALRAATRDAAESLGIPDTGTIAVGKRADLVLLFGNPLDDITNVRLQAGVVLAGTWLDQRSLRERLDDVRAARVAEGAIVDALDAGDEGKAVQLLDESIAALGTPPFDALAFNEFGYTVWKGDRDIDLARSIFTLNTRAFPTASWAWESLAECHRAHDDATAECDALRHALDLDPNNATLRVAWESARDRAASSK